MAGSLQEGTGREKEGRGTREARTHPLDVLDAETTPICRMTSLVPHALPAVTSDSPQNNPAWCSPRRGVASAAMNSGGRLNWMMAD